MIQKNISLANYSNFKTGGSAAYFLEVSSEEELTSGLKEWQELNLPLPTFVLGKGTNVLINDNGFNGLLIHNQILGIIKEELVISIGAGVQISDILNFCIENSLSGFEWAGGLPGTIGGAVRGNAGAFGSETKDSVLSAKAVNIKNIETTSFSFMQCDFSYRNSFFKKNNQFILTEVKLKLEKGDKKEIEKEIKEKIEYRKQRHPIEYPTLGSTFKNVPYETLPDNLKVEFKDSIKNDPFPVIPVVKFLLGAGLKGLTIGNAQLSQKHPNFVINLGNATSEDAAQLIKSVKEKVKEKYKIELEEEIVYLK